jgi:pimeloyl-ACP methyl ester carboxylesterase
VVLVDLRLHGGSRTGFDAPHTLLRCAEDVLRLESHLGLPADVLLGHSFGGKVALVRAEQAPHPRQVWVIDSTLRVGPPTGSAWRVIEIVRTLPRSFSSREELADMMVSHGFARPVGLWLAMNLERGADGFVWKLDWQGVEEMLLDYFSADVWPVIEQPPVGTDFHIVRATESDAIDAESRARVRSAGESNGRVSLHEIPGGHWVNVDNPEGVLDALMRFLPAPI